MAYSLHNLHSVFWEDIKNWQEWSWQKEKTFCFNFFVPLEFCASLSLSPISPIQRVPCSGIPSVSAVHMATIHLSPQMGVPSPHSAEIPHKWVFYPPAHLTESPRTFKNPNTGLEIKKKHRRATASPMPRSLTAWASTAATPHTMVLK